MNERIARHVRAVDHGLGQAVGNFLTGKNAATNDGNIGCSTLNSEAAFHISSASQEYGLIGTEEIRGLDRDHRRLDRSKARSPRRGMERLCPAWRSTRRGRGGWARDRRRSRVDR